jgi:hypothetical protein
MLALHTIMRRRRLHEKRRNMRVRQTIRNILPTSYSIPTERRLMKTLLLRGIKDCLVALDYCNQPFSIHFATQTSNNLTRGFQASATKKRSALFRDIARRIVVVPYRRFATTCRSHTQGHPQGGELQNILNQRTNLRHQVLKCMV